MSDVKRLLDEATPLPWAHHDGVILTMRPDHSREIDQDADYDLIVHAVNNLPAYEAAVEALAEMWEDACNVDTCDNPRHLNALAALRRLRGEVPA